MFSRHLLFPLILAPLFFWGCADPNGQYIRNGKEYGLTDHSFRGLWWNYYQRGKSFSEGGFYREAIADFNKATEERATDQWRVQLDNKHFIDYFPHRELGVVYFQRRKYELAIKELESSIQSAPNAKAYYFLNKARAAKLRQEDSDTSAPKLYVEGSTDTKIVNSFTHMVKGVAEDDNYVASIQVGATRVPIELAQQKRVFTAEIPLDVGLNIIQTIATDLTGKATTHNFELLCDRSGPLVEVLQTEVNGNGEIIHGVVSDSGGLKSLIINDKPWKITGMASAYNFKLAIPKDGMTIVATDRAGNITRATLSESKGEENPLLNPRVAGLDTSTSLYPDSMVVSDAHLPLLSSNQGTPTDTEPPIIELKNLDAHQETYENYLLLEGMVADVSPIHSISVNGEPLSHKNGKKLYFSQLRKLAEDDNKFIIVAIDTHGNRSEKNIKVQRKIEKIRQIESRMSVAILPFDHNYEESTIGELIYDQIIESFIEQRRFNIVERKKIEAVLQELKLSDPELLTLDKAVNLGKIVAADAILTGTIIETIDSVEIIGHFIDTETATILARNDVFSQDMTDLSLKNLLDGLALKFKYDFPLFEGILIEISSDEVLIDIGSAEKIKPNLNLICYRDGFKMKHPVTGRILGADPQILSDLTIVEVFENFSKAIPMNTKGELKIYDRFISK